ncbi:MAG: DNA repair protein RecO [Armatimonadota bacterium]|nr:MAG: DNA repair protein RecO [Armatimonadota bacterium]
MPRPRLYRVSALVLRQRDLGETDRILALLTRERGKVVAVAKGARRPRSKLAAGAQLFCCSNLQLAAGANLDIVTQCQVREPFYGLREDLTRLSYASYFADLVDSFVEEQDGSQQLFDLLYAALAQAEHSDQLELLARVFELRLLNALGYAPELGACIRCGEELGDDWVGFSPALGGAICRRCAEAEQNWRRLSAGALRTARICVNAWPGLLPRVRLTRVVAAELAVALRSYVDYYLGRRMRSASFLEALPGLLAAPQRAAPNDAADD